MDSLNSLPVMDNLNISPQLIASLATIIQKQILTLQQQMSPQQQRQQQMPPQQQQQQLPPQQQQHRQHQAPPQTQQTPVVKRSSSIVSNASISRSSSISRSGSLSSQSSYDSSSCSTPPSSNKRPKYPPRLKRKKKSCHRVLFADREEESQAPEEPDAKQTKSDRKVVIQEVLSFFDSPFLATPKSILFKRQLCKTHGKPNKPTLKQRPEMDPDLFRLLVVVPLRRLMGEAYATNYNLAQRYRAAAAKVVKKRRANHIQSWRPKNGVCARTLITRITLSHTFAHERTLTRTHFHSHTRARAAIRTTMSSS